MDQAFEQAEDQEKVKVKGKGEEKGDGVRSRQ